MFDEDSADIMAVLFGLFSMVVVDSTDLVLGEQAASSRVMAGNIIFRIVPKHKKTVLCFIFALA